MFSLINDEGKEISLSKIRYVYKISCRINAIIHTVANANQYINYQFTILKEKDVSLKMIKIIFIEAGVS